MIRLSRAELLLAYRHAKHALFQEQRGMTRLDCATAEDDLPSFLDGLNERLAKAPGWFSAEELGEIWIVPKRIEPIRRPKGLATVGEVDKAPARIHVRLHLAPATAFAVVEVLWLWKFGPALELVLGPHSYGNRLRMADGRIDVNARGPFEFWPKQYEKFRGGTFAAARRLLATLNRSCLLATFDLASCYDSIDPSFLLAPGFIQDVARRAQLAGVSFDPKLYAHATRTLIDKFETYRRRAATILGVRMAAGIPIGALTSGLIANLALAPLDDYVLRVPGVRHYARYVDDILLVADATRRRRTVADLAKQYLPVLRTNGEGLIVLDSASLGRHGSALTLTKSKLKGYFLRGRRGLDFLGTIERDVRWIASERRAFLNPDGLGSESPFVALVAGSDSNAPVQVLRDVDRLKVERYAAGVQLGKIAVGVEMLPAHEARIWCRQQIRSLVGMTTDADNWGDFADLTFRALGTCLRATDYRTARTILSRHRRRVRKMLQEPANYPIHWGTVSLRSSVIRQRLAAWFQMRHAECIAASIRLEVLSDLAETDAVLSALGSTRMSRSRLPRPSEIRAAALLFARCDLRTVDRENDRRHATLDDGAAARSRTRRGLSMAFRRDRRTSTLAATVSEFADVCESIRDRIYGDLTMLDFLVMTRPPTSFDVQFRFAQAGRSPSDAIRVTNALRGTHYPETSARGVPTEFLDVTPPFEALFGRSEITFLLGNLRSDLEWFAAAAKGHPELGSERLGRLATVVNLAIKKARGQSLPVLVLPELSVPREWLRPLVGRLLSDDISSVVGLEYERVDSKVFNHAVAVMSTGRHGAAVAVWKKGRAAREEDRSLSQLSLVLGDAPSAMPVLVRTTAGIFSVLICSELLDVELRSSLIGRIDFLVVPAWNKDTATFDHTVQTVANDLHCYVAVANNGLYSDSRVFVPKWARHERDVCRLICRSEDDVLAATINVTSLRRFQEQSLADREFPPPDSTPEFKAVPPAFRSRRHRVRTAAMKDTTNPRRNS